jgi:hypothetical protein
MLFHRAPSMAVAAVLAGLALGEPVPQPYKLNTVARMSVRNLFGLSRRQDGGYSPDQQFCGSGDTCAEACGAGFEQCASGDGEVHCFNKAAEQTCCPGQTGGKMEFDTHPSRRQQLFGRARQVG